MTSLHPYQQELLDILQDPTCPRFGVVTSVPGSGIRRAVEIRLREVASVSLALVLCPTRVAVDQWAQRLRAYEDTSVTVLISASAALGLLEERPRRRTGILVATYARTRHGPSSQALSELDFGLIVHDQPPWRFSKAVERLNSQAQGAIAVIDRQQRDSWSRWPLLWDMTSESLTRGGYSAPISVPYEPTPEERALHDEAIDVLREHALRRGAPLILPSDSIPELHALLLTLTSEPPEREDLAERAWTLLDRMEDSLTTDSRLMALDRVLETEMAAGAKCVVLAATQTDTRYIADHLASTGKAPHAVLSTANAHTVRRSAMAGLNPGECLVATYVLAESADGWPADSTVILWPSPVNQRVLEELFLTAEDTSGVTVLELNETNQLDPLTTRHDQERTLGAGHLDMTRQDSTARVGRNAGVDEGQRPVPQLGATPRTSRLVFVLDVVAYARRTDPQRDLQSRLQALVDQPLTDIGAAVDQTVSSSRGNGMIVLLPDGIDFTTTVPRLIRSIAHRLAVSNEQHRERLRLRMAIGAGPVSEDPMSFTGSLIVDLHRLVDSQALRRAVTDHPGSDLVVLVEEALHDDLISTGHVEPIPFLRVEVSEQEYEAPAWLWVTS
jgi:hypothetical protein